MTDIDIEEHDVLQNPILREIFPDLSQLKKEIIDVNEDKTEINLNEDVKKTAIFNSELSFYTKTSLNAYEDKHKLTHLNNATVVLDNINNFLVSSQSFCTHCLILFPGISSFHNHQVLFHKDLGCSIDNKSSETSSCFIKDINIPGNTELKLNNGRTKKISLKSSYLSCVHCDMLFPTEKSLIDHLYEVLNAKKIQNSNQNLDKQRESQIAKERLIYKLKVTNLKKNVVNKTSYNKKTCYKYFYFCYTCKCYIPQTSRVDIHLQSLCKKFIKYTCEDCGLTLPKKSINIHRKSHSKNPNLSLQDFIFYDLKTKTKIKPCQVLPKCNTCDVYFIHKHEITSHLCKKAENLECPICGIKLSGTAYKVHVPFHNYILKNNNNKIPSNSKITQNESVNYNFETCMDVDTVEPENEHLSKSTHNKLSNIKVATIYTCKNCDISVNEYDEVVNHCQLHNNLNDLKLDSIECNLCNLKFISSHYKLHQDLHATFTKDQFKQFIFDVLYFASPNDVWLKYLFGNESKNCINKYIGNSIYKDECRIKFNIVQEGSAQVTIYKCGKCNIFIDSLFVYQHMAECCINTKKILCKFCSLPFIDKLSMCKHESVHTNFNITSKRYRIVTFNLKEHEAINIQIANTKKHHILYQCRFCHALVDKNTYEKHECYTSELKKCNKCGLLIQEAEYNLHTNKHNNLDTFNKDLIYIILLGSHNSEKTKNKESRIVPTFSGMVSDYTFYKCAKCEVCLRDYRSPTEHHCLIKTATSECPNCGLLFDKGKFKGHLRLHDNDPYFTKDTIMIKIFGVSQDVHSSVTDETNVGKHVLNDSPNTLSSDTVKIYKCACGLHFLNKVSITEHSRECRGRIKLKQSKQNCLKCGLTFSHDILFKHLLKHHKGKNAVFQYEIVNM